MVHIPTLHKCPSVFVIATAPTKFNNLISALSEPDRFAMSQRTSGLTRCRGDARWFIDQAIQWQYDRNSHQMQCKSMHEKSDIFYIGMDHHAQHMFPNKCIGDNDKTARAYLDTSTANVIHLSIFAEKCAFCLAYLLSGIWMKKNWLSNISSQKRLLHSISAPLSQSEIGKVECPWRIGEVPLALAAAAAVV